jgi:hypothetical protein
MVDKRLLQAFASIVLLWTISKYIDTYIYEKISLIKNCIHSFGSLCSGSSIGLAIAMWINGTWKRLCIKE